QKIELQSTRDQRGVRLALQAEDPSGQWKPVNGPVVEPGTLPVTDLRHLAGRELKSRGVDYILVFGSDLGADDFRQRASEWGIHQGAELGNDRLSRID